MIAILLVAVLASASAAPRHHKYKDIGREIDEEMDRAMAQLYTKMSDASRLLPSTGSSETHGNQYIMTIPLLLGLEEKEIVVHSEKGLLRVQVTDDHQNTFMDVRSLPACVGEGGTWSYENGIIKVVLPAISDCGTNKETVQAVTPAADRSREETDQRDE